jgi:peptidylprolyl isomerase
MTLRNLFAAFFMAGLIMSLNIQGASALDLENTVYLDLKDGRVTIALEPKLAPLTVARFKELVRKHFYDGLAFHRVIPGFMAQTGDPRGDGTGGSGQNLTAEFSREHFSRGSLGLARAQDPNSGDSQFFICFADAEWLDGQYTLFGKVVDGMERVDAIKAGSRQGNGKVSGEPDKIVKMSVAADVK